MNDNLTEGDKRRIREIVQSIVNVNVMRDLTRMVAEQKAEERRAMHILLVVLVVFAIVAIIYLLN